MELTSKKERREKDTRKRESVRVEKSVGKRKIERGNQATLVLKIPARQPQSYTRTAVDENIERIEL